MRVVSQKISALFLICLVSLTITGYAYSNWTDMINIFNTVDMGNIKITIDDQKLIPDIGCVKNGDNKTVTISASINRTGWEIWVGIIIKNKGTVPVAITNEVMTNNVQYEKHFANETHYYGPYTTVPPGVWNDINAGNPPPPLGEQPTPIDLPTGEKIVVWQKLTLKATTEYFTITITSEYTAKLSVWEDTVEVVYYLRVK